MGLARPVYPTTDTGTRSYTRGRVIAAGDPVLDYSNTMRQWFADSGTIALRFSTTWAGNDGATHMILSMRNGPDTAGALDLFKYQNNKWYFRAAETTSVISGSLSFAADTLHTLIARWTNGPSGTLDLNHDGTDIGQSAHAHVLTVGKCILGASGLGLGGALDLAIVTPQNESPAWVAQFQPLFASGASVNQLWTLLPNGSWILPNNGDSVAYVKVGGGSLRAETNLLALCLWRAAGKEAPRP